MTKTNKKLMSLVVAVMYALCILVAAPVTAYADTSSHQTSAYTATQKWRATYYAQKSLAGLPSSKYASWSYHTGDSAKLQLLVTVTERRLATAKKMGLNIKKFKNYYRLAIAKARVVVLLANEARVAAAALAAKAAKLVVDTASAKVVTDSIVALPTTITLANAAAVTAARTAYTALNAEAKALVLPASLATLVAAELKIVGLNGVLTFDSIATTNNKQVVLTFSSDVDVTTGETVGNYTLSAGGPVTDAVVSGKTVTLTLTAAQAQQVSIDVTAKNVKGVNGKTIANTTKTVKFFDVAVPAVLSAVVTGPNVIKVTFSEPITGTPNVNTTANFVIDSNTYSIASVVASGENAVLVTLGSTLPAGAHTITVNNVGTAADPAIKDYAGFYAAKTVVNFNYVADTTAPTVSLVSASQNKVVVKFSKAITTNVANLRVYHTYASASYAPLTTVWDADKMTVTATFSTYLPVGTATIYVQNADAVAANQLKDAWGNAFVNATLTSPVTADTTAPVVSSQTVISATSIEVAYSEPVTGAATAANYTLKDSAAAAVAVTSAVLKAGTTSTYTLTTATMNGGAYTLSIAGIKDTSVNTNAMVAVTLPLAVNDLIRPTVTAGGVLSTDLKKIVVKFSEAMNAASITNIANYQINTGTGYVDLSTITGASVTAGAGNKSAVINLTSVLAGLGATDTVLVGRVADVAGNTTAAFTTVVTLAADDIVFANLDNAKATSTTTVTFEVDSNLSSIDVTKFTMAAGAKAATGATYVNGDNMATVTVTVATIDKFASNLSAGLVDVRVAIGGLTTVLGTSNTALVILPVASIDDYVAPAVVSTVTGDITPVNGHLDTVTVTYDENLYIPSVTDADYTVEGYTVSGVSVTGAVVTLSLTELASFDTATTPKVTLVGAVSDNSAQRNSLGAQAFVTAVDAAGPIARTATTVQTSATGTLTLDTNPTAADTMTIGGTVYTFVTTANFDAVGEVELSAVNVAGTQANLLKALAGTDGVNAVNTKVSASAFAANVTTITAKAAYKGAFGNTIATTETFTAGTNVFSAATMIGGTDVVTVTFNEGVLGTSVDTINANTDFAFVNAGAAVITGTVANTTTANGDVKTITLTASDKQILGATVAPKATQLTDVLGSNGLTTAVTIN